MVSKGMLNSGGKFRVDLNSAQILDFDEIKKNGKPRKFGRPSENQGFDLQGFSDHYPIAVKIIE